METRKLENLSTLNTQWTLMDLLQSFSGSSTVINPYLAVEFASYFDSDGTNDMYISEAWPEFHAGYHRIGSPAGNRDNHFYLSGIEVRNVHEANDRVME